MKVLERPIKVLVVEDECLIAVDLADLLTDYGFCVCGIVRSADEAIEAARTLRPDIIVTDIRLAHGSNGIEAAKRIRADFGIRSCFLSGSIDVADMEEARGSAPIGFLTKPFEPSKLLAMLVGAAETAPPNLAGAA